MKRTVDDSKLIDKFSASEKRSVLAAHDEGLKFAQQDLSTITLQDYENKKSELEAKFVPLVTKIKLQDKKELAEYCDRLKQTLMEPSLQGRFTARERDVIYQAHKEGLEISKKNEDGVAVTEFGDKLVQVERKLEPIMERVKRQDKEKL